MKIIFALVYFVGLLHIKGHGSSYLPSDCNIDNCVNSLSRINKTNQESYCSGLVTSWICLERILGNCYQLFEGYGNPEVNKMVTNITSIIDDQCDYNNSGSSITTTNSCFFPSVVTLLVFIFNK